MNRWLKQLWRTDRRQQPRAAAKVAPAPAPPQPPSDYSAEELATVARVRDFTMTSTERIVAAIRATEYVARRRLAGGIVECGVWRGGSMMAMALTLLARGRGDVPLYLFDTFEGMSAP